MKYSLTLMMVVAFIGVSAARGSSLPTIAIENEIVDLAPGQMYDGTLDVYFKNGSADYLKAYSLAVEVQPSSPKVDFYAVSYYFGGQRDLALSSGTLTFQSKKVGEEWRVSADTLPTLNTIDAGDGLMRLHYFISEGHARTYNLNLVTDGGKSQLVGGGSLPVDFATEGGQLIVIPEPGTLVLLGGGVLGLLRRYRRK